MRGLKQAIGYGIALIAVVAVLAALPLYVDWLWFKDLGYSRVFSTVLASKTLLGISAGLLFFLVVWGSAWYALKTSSGRIELYTSDVNIPVFLDRIIRRGVEFVVLFGSIVLAILVGLGASTYWQSWIAFRNYVPFGQLDPVFHNDIGFYVFRLEFITFMYRTAMLALIAAGIASAAILYLTRTVDLLAGKLKITGVAAGQLGVILALIAALQAVGFRLSAYGLLYSEGTALLGAGYTDVHIRLLAANLAVVASLAGAVLVLAAARKRSLPLAVVGVFLGLIVQTVIGGVIGGLVQRVVVMPDESNKETPYLARHMNATQYAYGLEAVKRTQANLTGTLTPQDLKKNRVTLQSVRLWDYKPLQAAYGQLQEIQQYYAFNQVDIDRYYVNGVYRQVMLGVREMDQDALPETAQTWVNTRLKYTHGYGLSMSPVNEVSEEGLPRFFVKDIPPASAFGLRVDRPQVYFGERTSGFALVNTRVKEFDYPRGSEGVYSSYQADSGVKMGGLLRRAILAIRFADLNLLLPGNITPDSRILFRRNIQERASTLAPFLMLDDDPYPVVHDGRIVWIQDAYTRTERYPYSIRAYVDQGPGVLGAQGMGSSLNYIRNSVKIVTDAYTGKVTFYVFDQTDPIIRSLERAFPGMFHSRDEMPEDLQNHVRYPEYLFRLQTSVYQTFHMTDTQQFYNKGDVWAIPSLEQSDSQGDERAPMEPYYVVMKLPDAPREEFILLMPFSRANKDNMVAWMAAKCDKDDYGKMVLYEFPKGEQFFGPAQIQARANQNTEISEQMTLWNQQKSSVIRGNLLVIPIEKTVLYVEPLYLQSTNARIPEFKRVIVALGDQITMQPTLSEALNVLVGGGGSQAISASGGAPATGGTPSPAGGGGGSRANAALAKRALALYQQSLAAQRQGDWAEYGRKQKELGDLLNQAAAGTK